jgi:predicted component of type VI protein secretion system
MFGELVPVGGGDPIPLLKKKLLVGRREGCDITLRFSNVSAHHCQLSLEQGYWFVKDLKSRNGTKINGTRVTRKRMDPGDLLAVAKHRYTVNYSPVDLGAAGPPPPDEEEVAEILSRSLLDRAGLVRRKPSKEDDRYNVLDDSAGQIDDPNQPV